MRLQKFLVSIFIFFLGVCTYAETTIPKIEYKKVELNTLNDIDIWKNSNEVYTFTKINIDLRELPTLKKKNTFIAILLPAINVVNLEINNNREIVKNLSRKENLSDEEKNYLENLFKKYRVEYGDWNELNSRLIIYPTSLILTQGAIESAWGTSRFFREGNNLFGMWSTDPSEPRIAAKGIRDNGFVPHLKKYESIKDSVADFILNFSRNNSYKTLRNLLNDNNPPQIIATGLVKYSEEGELYVKKVINTMEYNKFNVYDSYMEQ